MIYLDNAATTFPKPYQVIKSVENAIINYGGNPGRGGHSVSMKTGKEIYRIRKNIGEFFNAEPERVIFTLNCSMSLNMAIKGCIKNNTHVITSCLEHNSVIRPLEKLKQTKNIEYDMFDISDDKSAMLNNVKSLKKANTGVLISTFASNVSGFIMPIKEIGEYCKKNNIIFIVDAAQAGGIIDIDIKRLNIDILCLPGHKGLYGIMGSGLLILNDNIDLETIIEGGTGSQSISIIQPDFYPDRLESGTISVPAAFSIDSGIDYIRNKGIENMFDYEKKLCNYVFEKLNGVENIEFLDKKYNNNVPILSFNIKGYNSEALAELYNDYGYALRGGLHCSGTAHKFYNTIDTGAVRFAPSTFNKEKDIIDFVKITQKLAKTHNNT